MKRTFAMNLGVVVLMAASSSMGATTGNVHMGRTARQQANAQIEFWQKQINQDKNTENKYRDFTQMVRDLQNLGQVNMRGL